MHAVRYWLLASLLALTVGLPVGAQKPASLRSASHRFEAPPSNNALHVLQLLTGNRFAVAATGKDAAWYSAGVNTIFCSLLRPDETWLGTAFGLKRLDLRTRMVQHYTVLDGLPYPRIAAVAAHEKTVLCASVRQEATDPIRPFNTLFTTISNNPLDRLPHTDSIALCRFNASTGKWRVLAAETREYSKTMLPPVGIDTEALPQQWVAANKAFACLVPGAGVPGKSIALLCRLADNTLDRIPTPDFKKSAFAVTTMQMDDANLWLGSSQGLLRYDLKTRQWETLLPDAAIFGSVRDHDGSLWILARTSDPYQKDMEQGLVRTVHWMAVHFVPGQPPRSYLLKNRAEAKSPWETAVLENITLAEGKVWITVNQRLVWGHGQDAYPPTVFSLDPETGKVTVEAAMSTAKSGDYDRIPASALANSHTGWGLLTPLVMPARFPGWVCAYDPKEAALLDVPTEQNDWAKTRDEEGRIWTSVSVGGSERLDKFLKRDGVPNAQTNVQKNFKEEIYAPDPARFTVHDTALFPVPIGDKVYFLTGTYDIKLRAWNRKTERVEAISAVNAALKQYRPRWDGGYRMLPGKNCLWIGTGEDVLRYDLVSGKVNVSQGSEKEKISYVPAYALLAADGDTAWVKSAPNRLYTANPILSHDMTPVPLPAFPGDLERVRDKMVLFALEDHIAWFRGQSFTSPNTTPLIGYDLKTRSWTKPFDASLPSFSAGETLTTYKQGEVRWFPAASREAAAYGYNTASGQWTTLPPAPASVYGYPHTLVAVDEQNAWLCGNDHLFHLDRSQGTWNQENVPYSSSTFHDTGSACQGDRLYFGTSIGVWSYDTTTQKLAQSPAIQFASEDMEYRVMAVDAAAVWLNVFRADAACVARFDRNTHAWKYWSAEDGLPHKQGQLTADGRTCWLHVDDTLYHLNPQTNRWDNISRQLASANGFVPIKQTLVDGDAVWLVSGSIQGLPQNSAVLPPAPLYRYDIRSEQLTPVTPLPGTTLTPGTLVSTANALFLTAKEGVYRLDRASGQWKPLEPPLLPGVLPALVSVAAREEGENVWIIGDEYALRFRKTLR